MRKTGFYSKAPFRWAEREIYEAYLWDKLEAAYEGTLRLGVGQDAGRSFFFRRVESEYLTRKVSVIEQVNDWLTLEFVPSEAPDVNYLKPAILNACDEIARRLEWTHGPKVMVSILAEDTDAPWLPGRYGVFIDKYPYDKICIPLRAAADPARLHQVIVHEYAHEIVLDLTQGHAPRWLNEMVAKVAEGGPNAQIAHQFAIGALAWLDPFQLGIQYIAEVEDRSNRNLANAYEQSACIGAFLVSLKGEKYLSELLQDFKPPSVWKQIWIQALNRPLADEALKRAYGMSEREVFTKALEWLRARY